MPSQKYSIKTEEYSEANIIVIPSKNIADIIII